MPCTDNQADSEYEMEKQQEADRTRAIACGLLHVLENNNALEEALKKFDFKKAGVSEKELLQWWKGHKARDQRLALEQWRYFAEEIKAMADQSLSRMIPSWGDTAEESLPTVVFSYVLEPREGAKKALYYVLCLEVTSKRVRLNWVELPKPKGLKLYDSGYLELFLASHLVKTWPGLQEKFPPLKTGLNLTTIPLESAAVFFASSLKKTRLEDWHTNQMTKPETLDMDVFPVFQAKMKTKTVGENEQGQLLSCLRFVKEMQSTHELKTRQLVSRGLVNLQILDPDL